MNAKFEEILAYVHVVELKSFTKAAEMLGVTKSSLSRRVANLEKRLGVQLLQRTTRQLYLTQQGEYYYERSQQILADVDEMENTTIDAQKEIKGRIKIALPLSFAQQDLTQLLSEFVIENPNIDLIIDLNDRQIDLIEDRFDLAIRIGQLKDSTLIAKKLGEIHFVTCASPDYLKAKGVPKTPFDLKHHKGIYYGNSPESVIWVYSIDGKQINCAPIKSLVANNGHFIAQCAINNVGIIRSPHFIVKQYLESKKLVPILMEYEHKKEGVYAVYPPGRMISARIRKLVECIEKKFYQLTSNKVS